MTTSLIALFAMFAIGLTIQLVRLLTSFERHIDGVNALVQNVNKLMRGAALAHERWTIAIANSDYTVKHLDVNLTYADRNGHRVTLTKKQGIVAHRDDLTELWDRNLKTDGELDWASALSIPGEVEVSRQRKLGTTFEVPTSFGHALPNGRVFHRTFRIDMIESFKLDIEDLICTLERPVEAIYVTIVAAEGMYLENPIGEQRFGCYKLGPEQLPYVTPDRKQVCWNISNPQIGEVYRLQWTRQFERNVT